MRIKTILALVAALAAFILTACGGGSGTTESAEDYPSTGSRLDDRVRTRAAVTT